METCSHAATDGRKGECGQPGVVYVPINEDRDDLPARVILCEDHAELVAGYHAEAGSENPVRDL